VTSVDGNTDVGSTVNAIASLSVAPPMLMVSLFRESSTLAAIEARGLFCLSLLEASAAGEATATAFAKPGPKELAGVGYARSALGILIPDAAIAVAELELVQTHVVADHVMVIGVPLSVDIDEHNRPLAYWRSEFHRF
jgi:flavin reductase (DIM6/NTAB) family NADH-FMN oxidoreductase RutF